ncbi:MAG: methyltransferase domain-containing protein [Cyanothece sp. SIO2G6]|nr:methyltransferase domain-containing protein [Cyanothece sp. SIO2G6]
MKALNLGCGRRYQTDWTNIDFRSGSEFVSAHDLSKGIPALDESFDLVYHSHLLEHFTKDDAEVFIQECFRVLRPQGILRVVVPDLEQVTRAYLTALEHASGGSTEWCNHYDWMIIELLDQSVRTHPRGKMGDYLSAQHIPNQDFVIERLGTEAKKLTDSRKQESCAAKRVNSFVLNPLLENAIKPIYRFLRHSSYRREWLLKSILGEEFETLELGRFRKSGEIHQWMYDCFSLKRLLEQNGFVEVIQRTAIESYVPDWSTFNLDTEPDGSIYKPDSLFMEAIKPDA